jgi:hypothetical protein
MARLWHMGSITPQGTDSKVAASRSVAFCIPVAQGDAEAQPIEETTETPGARVSTALGKGECQSSSATEPTVAGNYMKTVLAIAVAVRGLPPPPAPRASSSASGVPTGTSSL